MMLIDKKKKWDYALGMIKIDGLEPSPEFKDLIEKEKEGKMTTDDIRKVLDKKYKMKIEKSL
ncbi:MAG: antitoxin VbhA family protein [Coprobacillaceae bacterium]